MPLTVGRTLVDAIDPEIARRASPVRIKALARAIKRGPSARMPLQYAELTVDLYSLHAAGMPPEVIALRTGLSPVQCEAFVAGLSAARRQ
jgi:hypothetical protein